MDRTADIRITDPTTKELIASGTVTWAAPAEPAPAAPAPEPAPAPAPAPERATWITTDELMALPASGAAWSAMYRAAIATPAALSWTGGNFHGVQALARALVGLRAEHEATIAAARAMLDKATASAMASPWPSTAGAWAVGRNLVAHAVTVDLVGEPRHHDWLARCLTATVDGQGSTGATTIVAQSEREGGNWGTACLMSRTAIAATLGDAAQLDWCAEIFAGWLGERPGYNGFEREQDGTALWMPKPNEPWTWVLPPGARLAATGDADLSGALPAEMIRGGRPNWPPSPSDYPWVAFAHAVTTAEILHKQGFTPYLWADTALLRAYKFLVRTGWPVPPHPSFTYVLPILRRRYGTVVREMPAGAVPLGYMAFTDWTHG